MKNYDYNPGAPAARPGGKIEPLDLLSILVLILTACLGLYFTLIFINPASALNPLPPVNPFATPTYTITPIQLEPTWTASPTIEPTITETPRPTFTPLPSPTFFSLVPPTDTPIPTSTPRALYAVRDTKVDYVASTLFSDLQAAGCNWFGIRGSVLLVNNAPAPNIAIHLWGTLNGNTIDKLTLSGTLPNDITGQSGFQFDLGTVPVRSTGTLFLQLFDTSGQYAGQQISDNIPINTYNDCNRNLTLVRFKANRTY